MLALYLLLAGYVLTVEIVCYNKTIHVLYARSTTVLKSDVRNTVVS